MRQRDRINKDNNDTYFRNWELYNGDGEDYETDR